MMERSALPVHLRLKMFGAVLEFMRNTGVSEAAIRASFEQGISKLGSARTKGRGFRRDERHVGSISLSGDLLRLWHRDSRYIDSAARPKPLYISKGRINLTSALRSLDRSVNASEILQSMKAVGLIRRTNDGRYLPTAESAIIDELHPLLVEHVARSVIRLVSTICRNTDSSGKSLPLIERQAAVSDLDPSESKAFAEFTRTQGMAYLESVDDWLQQHRTRHAASVRSKRVGGVAASVHIVAYIGDEAKTTKLPDGRRSRSRIKPPPEARA
jgi:hypothetical protein